MQLEPNCFSHLHVNYGCWDIYCVCDSLYQALLAKYASKELVESEKEAKALLNIRR